jgi:hypothetical protein
MIFLYIIFFFNLSYYLLIINEYINKYINEHDFSSIISKFRIFSPKLCILFALYSLNSSHHKLLLLFINKPVFYFFTVSCFTLKQWYKIKPKGNLCHWEQLTHSFYHLLEYLCFVSNLMPLFDQSLKYVIYDVVICIIVGYFRICFSWLWNL